MSATTTLAPSRANAKAVARPIPLPAPVTNATRFLNVEFITVLSLPFLQCFRPHQALGKWITAGGREPARATCSPWPRTPELRQRQPQSARAAPRERRVLRGHQRALRGHRLAFRPCPSRRRQSP